MLGKIFNKVKAAIPQMIVKINAVARAISGISATMGKTSSKIEDTSDSRGEMLLEAFQKGDSLERGIVTTGAIKLNTMDVFDYVKFFTELEALPRQVEQPRQAYTQEQYEKDMAEYRKEKLMTDITLGLMSPFIAAEQIVRGFGEGAGALMAFPVETIQEVGSGIVQLDPSKNIITAPLYGVVTQTGPLLRGKLTPEELVQYQVDLFTVGTSAYGAANTASNLGSTANSFIKKRTTAQSVATPSGSGVRISDAVDDIGIKSLDDIAEGIPEGVGKSVKELFSEDSLKHLEQVDGFSKKHGGIKGAHTIQSFKKFSDEVRPVKINSKIEISDGVYEIKYQVAKMERGKAVEGEWINAEYTKTVIDIEVLPLSTIRKMAEEAFQGRKIYTTPGNQLYINGISKDGVKLEGWIDGNTGKLKSFYAVQEWQFDY